VIGKLADAKISNALIIKESLHPRSKDKLMKRILIDDNDIITRKSSQIGTQLPNARGLLRTSSKARFGGPSANGFESLNNHIIREDSGEEMSFELNRRSPTQNFPTIEMADYTPQTEVRT